MLGGIQPCPIPFTPTGELPLDAVEGAIKPDDSHFAMTRLVCLENTQDGKVVSLDYLARYSALCQRRGLRRHLDGARVFNAAVALNVPVREIARHFDTVSMCLSKGLGAPVGSILVGDAETISRARRWRKMTGGGMRQAGVIAAAGLHALQNHVDRLREDHEKASRVAEALETLDGFRLAWQPQTNMVFLHPDMALESLITHLSENGILVNGHRWVFHLDVSSAGIDQLITACEDFAAKPARARRKGC